MSLSIKLPTCLLSTLSATRARTLNKLSVCVMTLAACGVSAVHADATLTYELTEADGNKTVKQFSTARFFVRIDDPADTNQYLLFQAGKFFPLYSVDSAKKSYTRLTPEVIPYMSPESRIHHGANNTTSAVKNDSEQTAGTVNKPAPIFKPTKKTQLVAGIECRVVHELLDNKPVIEHCMANSARLGITNREVITISRLFEMSRNRDYGWLGVGTKDEEFVSIQSRDLRHNSALQLTALSAKPLPEGSLRIPPSYKEITSASQQATPDSKAE